MIKDGVTYRLITDYLGSVRQVVNTDTGEIVQSLKYDAWGKVLEDTAPGFQPFGYAGGLYDPETGLVHFGRRDYDPEIGRWTTRDPSGQSGGINVYLYVVDDPVNGYDPNGRWGVAIGGGGSADSVVAAISTALFGWPGLSGIGAGSGVFVDISMSRGFSVGFFDSFSGRIGLSAPAQVAGGATLAAYRDLDNFRGTAVSGKIEAGKIGLGVSDGVISASFGPGTPGSFFLGAEFFSTDLLGISFKPWGSGKVCRAVY